MLTASHHLTAFRRQLAPQWLAVKPWWVAYSGGLDSRVLLQACVELGLPVRAVHVNHHLQAAAEDMQAVCEQQCRSLGVPLDVLHVIVARKGGESLEAQARAARYEAIGHHVGSAASVVLTAHHQDDQIETILLTLLRGSGLEGLAGMPAFSGWPLPGGNALRLGRPLLGTRRADLQMDAEQAGLVWFDDPSNADVRLRRNWLRQEGLPTLRRQFPQVDASLLRLARQVGEAKAEWQAAALRQLVVCQDAAGRLLQAPWLSLEELPQLRVLRVWLAQSDIRISEVRLLELRDQLSRPQGGLRRVADDWAVRVRKGCMAIERSPRGTEPSGAAA